ncbi:MAG: ferritin-like domain-containing protein [Gammaproteobacteria bacterium]|nr:ferritin-like domain-containing protein [Gammaproteobacteria bacterium]
MNWSNVFVAAKACLDAAEISEKIRLSRVAERLWQDGALATNSVSPALPIGEPGRPARPVLVTPAQVPKRGLGSQEGRTALLHALAHIEFNAINLAWDAVYRFRDMPPQYYSDWIRVAIEEAYHFELLQKRLRSLGCEYGDLPAHDGLWDMAKRTAFDPMVRMALVPRVLEARGLDVTPGIITKLQHAGDDESVAALRIILRDEIGHVAIGSRWFHHECERRDLVAEQVFAELVEDYFHGQLRGPFHYEARLQAGFSEAELHTLQRTGTP